MSQRNLADKDLKRNLENNEGGTPAVKHLYKHPIKNRQIIKSNVQRRAIRRG